MRRESVVDIALSDIDDSRILAAVPDSVDAGAFDIRQVECLEAEPFVFGALYPSQCNHLEEGKKEQTDGEERSSISIH